MSDIDGHYLGDKYAFLFDIANQLLESVFKRKLIWSVTYYTDKLSKNGLSDLDNYLLQPHIFDHPPICLGVSGLAILAIQIEQGSLQKLN